jgi:hypothetical protein
VPHNEEVITEEQLLANGGIDVFPEPEVFIVEGVRLMQPTIYFIAPDPANSGSDIVWWQEMDSYSRTRVYFPRIIPR